jgi:hypothetical protein
LCPKCESLVNQTTHHADADGTPELARYHGDVVSLRLGQLSPVAAGTVNNEVVAADTLQEAGKQGFVAADNPFD